jgi:hypothetical protein
MQILASKGALGFGAQSRPPPQDNGGVGAIVAPHRRAADAQSTGGICFVSAGEHDPPDATDADTTKCMLGQENVDAGSVVHALAASDCAAAPVHGCAQALSLKYVATGDEQVLPDDALHAHEHAAAGAFGSANPSYTDVA